MITLITPTGGRPAAFALCERWMSAQRCPSLLQWIVVDDCDPPTVRSYGQDFVRPEPLWRPGDNTQARNLLAAIPHIKGDRVLIIEDDDYYSPHYIERMLKALEDSPIVGEIPSYYYNLKERSWRHNNNWINASLCQTAFRAEMLPAFEEACRTGERFIDLRFWEWAMKNNAGGLIQEEMPLCVGMKGLPGRPGIGCGHTPNEYWPKDDERFSMLYRLCGADAGVYIDIARGL